MRYFGHVRWWYYVSGCISDNMVRGSGSVQTNISLKKYSIENKYKSRLSIAMILLMIFSLAKIHINKTSLLI